MVKDVHCTARDAFSLWHRVGKPRQGPVYDTMRHSRSLFKYALRYCKRQEKQIKAELLASNLAEKDSKSFGNTVKALHSHPSVVPNKVNNANGTEEILNMWNGLSLFLANTLR